MTKRQTDKSSTQPRMLPPTLWWLVLVCSMISVCRASGRYDVDTDAYMDPRPAGPGDMHCHGTKLCYRVGPGSHDHGCEDQGRCCSQGHLCKDRIQSGPVDGAVDGRLQFCGPELTFKNGRCIWWIGDGISTYCGPDWTFIFGRCIRFFGLRELNGTIIRTWSQAKLMCKSIGSGLIAPKTEMENSYAVQEIKKLLDREDYGRTDGATVFIGLIYKERDLPPGGLDPGEGMYRFLRGWRYTTYDDRQLRGRLLTTNYDRTHFRGAWDTENGFPPGPLLDSPTVTAMMVMPSEGDGSMNGTWYVTRPRHRPWVSRQLPIVVGCEKP